MSEVKKNYVEMFDYLSNQFNEVNGYDFYSDLFPDNEVTGEMNQGYSKPNAIYLYTDAMIRIINEDYVEENRYNIVLIIIVIIFILIFL